MPVAVAEDKGVAVVMIASGLYSLLPPLCQILRGLSYSPVCCSVQERLMQPTAILALGVREMFLILICHLKGLLVKCEAAVLDSFTGCTDHGGSVQHRPRSGARQRYRFHSCFRRSWILVGWCGQWSILADFKKNGSQHLSTFSVVFLN